MNYISAEDDHNSVSNNRIRSVCEDSFGNLWIGTNGGLNKFSKKISLSILKMIRLINTVSGVTVSAAFMKTGI